MLMRNLLLGRRGQLRGRRYGDRTKNGESDVGQEVDNWGANDGSVSGPNVEENLKLNWADGWLLSWKGRCLLKCCNSYRHASGSDRFSKSSADERESLRLIDIDRDDEVALCDLKSLCDGGLRCGRQVVGIYLFGRKIKAVNDSIWGCVDKAEIVDAKR